MTYINIDIDVNLDMFDDDDLIDEIESRGWHVSKDATKQNDLTDDEITAILERFQMAVPGTTGYNIYEKLRKR
jgi:hypothetical protein